MSILIKTALVGLFAGALALLCVIFSSKMRGVFKFLANAALGFFVLIVFNHLGAFVGLHLGVNVISACTIGVLGFPGIGLLLLLQLLLNT